MRGIQLSKDIIPVAEFKTGIAKYLRYLREEKHPIVITQNGTAAAVLITPDEYDRLNYVTQFTGSVKRGIEDAESGQVYSAEQVRDKVHRGR